MALDADPATGVFVLDSYFGGYLQVGGTSLSSPMMAGLVAIADQGRVLNGLTTLDGSTQTLPLLYSLSSANYHDITTGNNGYPAGVGYDLASGIGSPIANNLISALAGYQSNPPATVTAPLSASLIQNGSYTFVSTINTSDAAATAASDALSLSVMNGTLNLSSTAGLTFVSGANGASSMTVTGTVANLNAAISNLRYTPTSGYSGADFLQVQLHDSNDNQTGATSVNITVNPLVPPTVTAPAAVAVLENRVYAFAAGSINVADSVASGTSDSLTLTVHNGYLTLASTTGLTFTNGTFNASSSMTFSGTLGNLNAGLNDLVYTPTSGYTGPDTLTVSARNANDGLTGSASVAINVEVITPPVVTAPSSANLGENATYTFPANSVTVADNAATGASDLLTLSATSGTITLASTTGLSFSNGTNNSSTMTINGTLTNINAALNGLEYTPKTNFSGTDTLKLSVLDASDNLIGTANVTLTITSTTNISAPSLQVLNENTSATFSTANQNSISVTDTAASGTSDSVSLFVTNGTLTLGSTNGLTVTGNGTSSIEINGTLANLNAALNGLVYTPTANYMGSDSLAIGVNDSGDNISASATISLAIAGWTDLTNQVATNGSDGGVNLTLLLPNGDLLAHGAGDGNYSANWYMLKPDSQGNYIDGTWTQVASMNVGRLYFGSVVLPNSDVFVVGGEYSSDGGFSRTAETYNPNTNTWTLNAPDPQAAVGDEEAELLPNGNILVANIENNGTEIYNPTTNTWSAGGNKIYADDVSDEEGWTKLPNGDILTYDIFASIDANKFLAEIYNPTTNTWSDASTSASGQPLPLFSTPETGYESGLLATLPDGRTLLVGTNGNTAFYNYKTNSWTLGPNLPVINGVQYTIGDGAGAILPNGNVVMSISPAVVVDASGEEDFPPPQYIYEFNPITNVFTDITPPPSTSFYFNYDSFIDDMLVLPTGQIFMTQFDTDPLVLTPGGAAQPSWMPAITSFTNNGNGNYTLTGTQLNGLDEGGYYGDDNTMATNYPIVQVTDDLTGDVYYATTSNWSSNWVATGNTPETVNVAFPSQVGTDPYTMVVIANGIASPTYYSNAGPPSVTAPSAATVAENSSVTFPTNAFALIDPAAVGTSDSLTLTVSHGTLELGSISGLTISSGGTGTSAMTVSGTMPALNAAIANLVYVPNSNYVGSDALQVTLHDSTDNLSASAKVIISVTSVPSPSLTVPSGVSLNPNTTYTFTGGALGVIDPEASGAETLSLAVNDGHLTFGSTSGLTFIFTSNGAASITVTGTLTSLNAALNTLVYAPNAGFSGPDTLQLLLTDPGDHLTATASVPITVNGPPAISAPNSVALNEDSSFTFSGTLGLIDAAIAPSDSLTLIVSNGTLTLASTAGLNFGTTSNDSSSITVTGTLANLNAALDGLVYTPTRGFAGTDLLRMSVQDATDSLSGSAGVELAVSAVPHPIIVVPPAQSINENGTYTFPQTPTVFFNIIDPVASGTSDTLTLSVADGTLTLGSTTGVTFEGGTANNSSSIIVNGTLVKLIASISQLVYTPALNFVGTDSVMFSVTDQNDSLTGFANVPITVNATGPNIIVPSGLNYTITQFFDSQVQNVNYVAADNNGNVWFTVQGGIGEVTSTGTLKTFSTSSFPALANPLGITLGTDGNMYFTAAGGTQSAIGEINTTTDQITELPVMTPGTQTVLNPFNFAQGNAITVGPDGNLWFVEPQLGAIGVMSLAGVNQQQISVAGGVSAGSIAFGPNGNLYIANDMQNANAIIEMTQLGTTVNTTPLPSGQTLSGITASVVVDNNGTIWFTELGSDDRRSDREFQFHTDFPNARLAAVRRHSDRSRAEQDGRLNLVFGVWRNLHGRDRAHSGQR